MPARNVECGMIRVTVALATQQPPFLARDESLLSKIVMRFNIHGGATRRGQ